MSKEITTGQDSFLDIVANLVGILIILVVVVGAQARHQLQSVKPDTSRDSEIAQLTQKAIVDQATVEKLRRDNEQLEQRIVEENQLAALLTVERHRMLVELELIRKSTEEKQKRYLEKLEASDQTQKEQQIKRVSYEQEKRKLEFQLAALNEELGAVEASASIQPQVKTETIDHYPSPIAKTVFAEEVHFRLADGKLSFVPMDELIATMKSEWKVKAEKLTEAEATIETVGPIEGYRLQYELAAETVQEKTEFGIAERRSVEFQRFVVLPQAGLQGETLEVAFAEGSDFRRRLKEKVPGQTTVSIWVYPEGFDEHAKVKTWLYENGFQMASWPLMEGRQISGGPNGFKTSAQ